MSGKGHSIPCLLGLAWDIPCWLCVAGLAEMEPWSCPHNGVCLLANVRGMRAVPKEPRDKRSSRAESVPAVPLLSVPPEEQELLLLWSQLRGCILLEAFRDCQRGRADFVFSCSSPRSVILHYCITVLKAENEESEEWIPVTFVKNATGRSNLLSLVTQQALVKRLLLSETRFISAHESVQMLFLSSGSCRHCLCSGEQCCPAGCSVPVQLEEPHRAGTLLSTSAREQKFISLQLISPRYHLHLLQGPAEFS